VCYRRNGFAATEKDALTAILLFYTPSIVLHTDTHHAGGWSGLHGPVYSQFYTRVDGGPLDGPHLTTPGSPSFNVSLGPPFGPRSSSPNHLLEVVVKATSETVNRWGGPTGQDSAVIFTGVELTGGTTAVVAPRRKSFNTLIFGDSITEGQKTNANTLAPPLRRQKVAQIHFRG